jgi:D-alanine-D-alanine ligase
MRRLSAGVVFGGRSVEHDVSIVTAHQIMAVLAEKHDVVPIYITREGRWLHSEALNDLEVYRRRSWDEVGAEAFIPPVAGYGGLFVPGGRMKRARKVPLDVVVPAIHGTYGEDGTLQGLLELADIPYTCSGVVGSAAGMDKVVMKACFAAAGLPVVPGLVVDAGRLASYPDRTLAEVEAAVSYPLFVKPVRLGSSVGIGRAANRDELVAALDVARRYDRRVLVERSMEGLLEINCSVLGGPGYDPRPSVCEQPVAGEAFLTFSDKYLRGAKEEDGAGRAAQGTKAQGMASQERLIPAPLPDDLTARIQEVAVAAFRAVDASGVARVDFFVDPSTGDHWVMEINTVPGSFSFYLWEPAGVSFDRLLDTLVDIALAGHGLKSELMFTFESALLESRGGVKARG